MALGPGSRLGPYEIISLIGEGGMGQVWRAHHTGLQRDDALKVLPDIFAGDPERLARFQREAQVLASLNHPNIAHVYGLEDTEGVKGLVMELVDGPTLADRIAQGPVPLDEAMAIARQIVDALETAHERGIVHRDLKPSNIKVRPDGTVKVLDFGLAKMLESEARSSSALSMSPTITSPAKMTGVGLILGTAAYMSPEQARGKRVDRRADIWAFGCILYEMLSGRRPFEADDVSLTLARVLEREVDFEALPASIPARVRQVIGLCLRKDPARRISDIRDVRLALEGAFDAAPEPAPALAAPPRSRWAQPAALGLAALILAGLTGLAAWTLKPASTDARPIGRFRHRLPEGAAFTRGGRPLMDVSPDGTRIVYVANNQLYLRNLNEVDARPIQGTDVDPSTPVFSPDGQWVAFWSADQLKKIPITGGTPVPLCSAENPFGASWSIDNWVWFADTSGIKRVSGNGGESELLVETGQSEQAHGPALLPDGRTLLFTLTSASGNNRWDQAEIVVQPLNGGDRKVVWKGGADARYVPSGHIVYALESTLLAMPFDLARLERTGGPVPVVEDAQRALSPGTNTGSAQYAFSRTGSLVYVVGTNAPFPERSLLRVDDAGTATSLTDERRDYVDPQVSPDGRRLAVTVTDPVGGVHIWIVDLDSGVGSQLTFEGSNRRAAWTPDGERLVFQSDRDGAPRLFWQVADGSRPAEPLQETKEPPFPGNVSRDGVLAFYTVVGGGQRDVFTLSLDSGAESAFLATPANERTPAFSPDGRWLAYASTESGRDEVFLRPYPPSGGGQYRVSEGGGVSPQWSPKGDTLYYESPSGHLMAVPIQTAPVFRRGRPREMFQVLNRFRIVPNNRDYDVHPRDGSFVFVSLVGVQEGGTATSVRQEINIVLNWFEELRQRVR